MAENTDVPDLSCQRKRPYMRLPDHSASECPRSCNQTRKRRRDKSVSRSVPGCASTTAANENEHADTGDEGADGGHAVPA